MQTNHTQGPWFVTAAAGHWTIRGEGRDIAYLPHRENVVANAHLIEAAPDLLEACSKAVEYLKDCDPDDAPVGGEVVKELWAAIRKAKGE